MVHVLCKCFSDDQIFGNVGDVVTNPDWVPQKRDFFYTPKTPAIRQGNGDWSYLTGSDWVVLEVEDADLMETRKGVCQFRTGKIVYRGGDEGLRVSFQSVLATTSQGAYNWASYLGDREVMRERIVDSELAYRWVEKFGDREVMRDRVLEPFYAYYWAQNLGDRDVMIHRITDPYVAARWASEIGDREVMMQVVLNANPGFTASHAAYWWARWLGDKDVMKPLVTDPEYAFYWGMYIGDREEMLELVRKSDKPFRVNALSSHTYNDKEYKHKVTANQV